MISINSNTPEETKEIGKKIAPFLQKGDTVILTGDLGAGKTMLVSGFLSFYQKEQEVSSPTFTILNEYSLTSDLTLFHFDVYRFQEENEFIAIGGEEFFDKGICFIEWGENIPHYLPDDYIQITLLKEENHPDSRTIQITAHGSYYDSFLSKISEVFSK